jgi:hypothetical protein
MFEWLQYEIAKVNTPKFFLVDGPALPALRDAIENSDLAVPPSYKAFVLQFGNARLYRQGNIYLVQVYASLVEAESDEGESLLQFGRTDLSLAYFKESLLIHEQESPVFEWYHEGGVRHTFHSFSEWLKAKCGAARAQFRNADWHSIESGPPPFSIQEKSIVEARRRFLWRVVGISPSGDLQFEVHNGSNIILPYLSIGIRGRLRPPKHGPLNGGVWLPVSSILPGQTKIIEKGCYKDLVDPNDVEAFAEPDPEPEVRDRYWEFKGTQ